MIAPNFPIQQFDLWPVSSNLHMLAVAIANLLHTELNKQISTILQPIITDSDVFPHVIPQECRV